MAVLLEGGCRVSDMREGDAIERGTLRIWRQISRELGARAISLRVLEFATGLSPGLRNEDCDEVLYVLEDPNDGGRKEDIVTVFIDGWQSDVRSQSGIYLRPNQTLTINNPGPNSLILISSQCPEPEVETWFAASVTKPFAFARDPERATVKLADRRAQRTADRWYRVLIDDEVGSRQVTQFVGSIPPGRAPNHFHTYEEVLFILQGEGRMWAGETNTPIARGSCIYLPKGQVHCVENTGQGELRLLGVFYPAGSPSVRYESSNE